MRYSLVILCFLLQYVMYLDGDLINHRISQPEYGFMLMLYFSLFILYTSNRLSFIVNRVTLFLGSISYSLYLLHNFISRELIIPGLIKYAHLNFWVACLGVALPTVLIIAMLVNKYVEKPAMNYIRTQYRKKNISI